MNAEQVSALIMAITAASNGIFYVLYREQLKIANERQLEADKRWQDVVADARRERDRLMEVLLSITRDATKSRKTPEMQRRINEAFSQTPSEE